MANLPPLPPFELPTATRLGRVRLQVADLARSLGFYADLLGFRVLRREGDVAVLGAHGGDKTGDEALLELHEYPGARPVPKRGRLGLYHVAVLLPTRAALGGVLVHLERAGVALGMSDHLVSEALYLSDPDGLGLEIYADRPPDTWHWVGGELTMATDPLDTDSLRAASEQEAGAAPWTGMPPGTTTGHIHLHVGDLARAAAFYEHALGLVATVRRYPGALFLAAGGYHHHLGLNTWAAGAPQAQAGDVRLLEWELQLPTPAALDEVAERLHLGYGDLGHGDLGWDIRSEARGDRGVRVVDPWGTALRLVSAPD